MINSVTTPRPTTLAAMALATVLAAHPAAGEDAGPAAAPETAHHTGDGVAPDHAGPAQAGPAHAPSAADAPAPPGRDISLLAPPRHGTALLPWHRAGLKALPGVTSATQPALRIVTPAPHLRPATGAPRNAVGLLVPPRPQGGVPAAGAVAVVTPAIRPVPAPPAAAQPLSRAAINGTAMGRLPTPAAIGGPARDRSGINGTLVKPRQ
jgi:hypothetical protein